MDLDEYFGYRAMKSTVIYHSNYLPIQGHISSNIGEGIISSGSGVRKQLSAKIMKQHFGVDYFRLSIRGNANAGRKARQET